MLLKFLLNSEEVLILQRFLHYKLIASMEMLKGNSQNNVNYPHVTRDSIRSPMFFNIKNSSKDIFTLLYIKWEH